MTLTLASPCKVNLLLNILGRRTDGFHELETVMQPVNVCDALELRRAGAGLTLTCDRPELPTGPENLVHRAAAAFCEAAGIREGLQIRLEKKIPVAAGLGGGSGNAATTLRGLNQLFGQPLAPERLQSLAAQLGSDVPFFLQDGPAFATGRGEVVRPLAPFPALHGAAILLAHPGFGIATAWAYRELAHFPAALNGTPGRAQRLVAALNHGSLADAGAECFNSLEAPALHKFPVLALYQEFLRAHGATVALMSGSGSTTFALFANLATAQAAIEPFQAEFGAHGWLTVVPL